VEAVSALEAREACLLAALDAAEECLVRLIQPRQHVLQDMGVDRLIFRKLRPDGLELGFLLKA